MFIDKLLFLLRTNNVTKKKLAADLQIGINSFKYWEKTGIVPNMDTVNRIAEYFGVSVSFLLGLDDAPATSPPTPLHGDVTFTPKEAELMRRMQELDDEQAAKLIEYMEFLIQQRKKKQE